MSLFSFLRGFTIVSKTKGTEMGLCLLRTVGRVPIILAGLAMLASTGCSGSSSATVHGTVTYMGNPVKGGNVTFVSTDGKRTVSTEIKEDGSYKLERTPVGSVKVCVETESMNPAKRTGRPSYSPPKDQTAPSGPTGPSQADMTRRYLRIPPQYADPDKTDLTYTVTGGDQEHNILLR